MTTPTDEPASAEVAPAASAPATAEAAPPQEPEFEYEQAESFEALGVWLVRAVERSRIAAGLLVMLGAAILRRLWLHGRAGMHLSVFALSAFAAAGIVYALSTRMERGVHSVTAVTRTKGRDVTHAMSAMRRMLDLFRAIGAALVAAAALLLITAAVQLTHR